MMKIKITREDGSLHSFDFYKKERCVFSISENGDMYYSIYGNGEFAKTILLGRIYKKLRQEQALEVIDVLTNFISKMLIDMNMDAMYCLIVSLYLVEEKKNPK